MINTEEWIDSAQKELAAVLIRKGQDTRTKAIATTEIYGGGKKYLVTTTVEKQKESRL